MAISLLKKLQHMYIYPGDWKNPAKADVRPWPLPAEKVEDVCPLLLASAMPWWKRITDVTVSALGLIIVLPLLLVVTAYIKAVSPGPVLFKQKRVGYLGRQFTIWKFRTMEADCDISKHKQYVSELLRKDKPMTKQDNSPHIIPFGNILRKSCVDELPQLVNVLRGEMSLVGPRPDVPYAVENYQPWHHARTDVFPGMTGLWQVNGKNRTTYNRMMSLDIAYTRQKSFWLDMEILVSTPISIVRQIKTA
ncbi:MAG: sugar transferase [Gammaproteobacteria bacterium]|nr:sugar transferase [Gammaproteobacteria bacterium]